MPHCHCYNGTLRGHCALRGHCTTRGVGYMGLTKNEKNLLNQVSKELNKASKMHKSQADRIRSLGSARRVQMIGNIIPNIEGKHVGTMIVAGVVGNTILASRLEKAKWWKNLTRGITITGIPITLAGVMAGIKGIRDENTTTMAAGGALSGIGLSYLATLND